ncbi:DNA mismatch repair protein mutS [Candidatus Symbiothrix dinenymphae]|nr:DNA mismatch repair protein mutS [Candidatus Symbiothrix dinenymphae]
MAAKGGETGMMRQHAEVKAKYPDAILLFRVGDFYETFGADAIVTSEILGITLTKRANGAASHVELAGFPHHALDTYLPKLVRAGKRVAICDQLEDPKLTNKIVKRGVTELVTPGVNINGNVLNHKENNFLAAVHFNKNLCGVAFLDISTGEFMTAEGDANYVEALLTNFAPKEVLIDRSKRKTFTTAFGSKWLTFEMEDWVFTETNANERLLMQFETANLKGFGVHNLTNGVVASGAILCYLDSTKHTQIGHIKALSRIEGDRFMHLDGFTIRSLELLTSMSEGGKAVIDVLDRTITPMGGRMMRRWLTFPLKDVKQIENRLAAVDYFFQDLTLKGVLEKQLSVIGDLERVISRVAVGRVNPREVAQLKTALQAIEPIKQGCEGSSDAGLKRLGEQLNLCTGIRDKIARELVPEPPVQLSKGSVINNGVNAELDELREIAYSGKDFLVQLKMRERENTGISSLNVSFNNVFGYYIEVSNVHKHKVPKDWIRKQTLVGAERYITQELKVYEDKILGAEGKIASLEEQLFKDLVQELMEYIVPIQTNAGLLAQIDCLLSFAKTAQKNKYIRPQIDDSQVINIQNGRHPVIEQELPSGEHYIPNDVFLDDETQQILIITGPNMAGKSALLRQTALITLMAQIGSFVPADAARIGIVDKIFTRVGASDNISAGESTFMVEMNEAANILNNLSERSLVLFDELGRGTSTYDGISIAWAIIEYIHDQARGRAKTLFATHYHELNEMEKTFKRIRNYNVTVKETDNKVIFLRKLVRGGSEHSFGIHVAKMAGMPPSIIQRSNEILVRLETENRQGNVAKPMTDIATKHEGVQMSFFQLDDPVLSQIRDEINNLDLESLSPRETWQKLDEIQRILKGK